MTAREQLSGRALDEACAKAMGTFVAARTVPTHYVDMTALGGFRRGETQFDAAFDRYSTDPTKLPEMLAWLQRFADVEIVAWRDLTVEAASIGSDAHRCDRRCNGPTLNEAVARLVVAVHAAQSRKGEPPK